MGNLFSQGGAKRLHKAVFVQGAILNRVGIHSREVLGPTNEDLGKYLKNKTATELEIIGRFDYGKTVR